MAMSLSSCAWWSGSASSRLLVSRSERFLLGGMYSMLDH